MAKSKDHRFANNPPHQERFPQERGGVETMSTAKPTESAITYPHTAEDGDEEFHIPQRRHAYGEFIRESHSKGVKKEQE